MRKTTHRRSTVSRVISIVALIVFIWYFRDFQALRQDNASQVGEEAILRAFAEERRDVIVDAEARVVKVLPDDNDGDRHQKLILELPSGHSLLLAHNIDLANRVPVSEGELIRFRGEYEFSEKGGVIHWTHHDPAGRHPDGWIEYQGQRYD